MRWGLIHNRYIQLSKTAQMIFRNTIPVLKFRFYFFGVVTFLLFALALTTSFGIGLIEVLYFGSAIFFAKSLWKDRRNCFHYGKSIVLAFFFNLLIATSSIFWSGFAFSALDNPIREVMTTLALGLIVSANPKSELLWYGVYIGVTGAFCIALYQRFGLHWDRAGGFHQIIMFGDIAMAMGLMSLASIQCFSHTRLAIVPYIAFIAGLAASLLSSSRGGWIALIPTFFVLYAQTRSVIRQKIIMVAVVCAGLIVSAFYVPQLALVQRVSVISYDLHQYNIGNPVTSIGARLEMWKAAWLMFSEHPILGVGRSNFSVAIVDLISRNKIHTSVKDFHNAHNELFHALATEGIFGGIALTLLYVAPIIYFIRSLRQDDASHPYALAGMIFVMSYVSFGLTQVLFSHHIGAIFYSLTVCTLAAFCENKLRYQDVQMQLPDDVKNPKTTSF